MVKDQKKIEILINENNIRINMKLISEEKSGLRAIITVRFGPIKVSGFTIKEGEYKQKERNDRLYLKPPQYQSRNKKYHATFWMENRDYWEILEKMIWREYDERLKSSESVDKDTSAKEEQNN